MNRDTGTCAPSAGPASPSTVSLESRRVYPLAALLLAPASVLGPLAHNLHQASLADAAPALVGTAVFAVVVWLVAVGVGRRANSGAALIASVWVVGSLYHIELVRHLNAALGGDYSMVRPLPFAVIVMVALTFALRGTRRWHAFAHTVLTSVAVAVLAVPVWHAAAFEWRHGAARRAYDADRAMDEMPQLARGDTAAARPDIYHVVFDRYGSEKTLARHYGVRDPIGAWLESRGFYVARDSHSNYLSTGHSLASTFHMDYLDELAANPRVTGNNWHPIFKMLRDNRVGRFLRARGYEHHQFGSWWGGTYNNPNADSNRPHGFSEFAMTYLRRTLLMPVLHLLPDAPLTMRLDWDNAQCQRVARQVDAIKRLRRGDRPLYVFAHILVPHDPYVFAHDGRCLGRSESEARGWTLGYAEQVAYADTIIRELVTTLLAPDRPPPVVLIQADEGPIPERDPNVPWQEATDEELRIKFGILNAFRFPGGDYRRLRQDMTPVNSYRALFGTLFGLDLPDLPDRMLAFPTDRSIYDFHDVTERIRCGTTAGPSLQERTAPPC
jgi:Sulfatase